MFLSYLQLKELKEARDIFIAAKRNAFEESSHVASAASVVVYQILLLHGTETVLLREV